ncbi:hypothetical protein N7534_009108 [Penicillium rubens]|nr:hypothetical protein N7534_009108 [Penicillium rubens]
MLSWQLASLMMAHSLNMAITLGGSILCCGELVASSPKKLSNQIPVPPAPLPILSAINQKSPCLNVKIEFQDPHTGSHSVGLFWSRDMKVNGGSRTLPTRAFGRRQIAEVNATFGAGQQKSPLSTFCQAYGDWSAGQLILTCSRPNRPMATVSQDALAEYPGQSALELVRSPRTLEPLYNNASAYYWDARKEQRHLPMHHLATCFDRLAARQPSEYDLNIVPSLESTWWIRYCVWLMAATASTASHVLDSIARVPPL